MLQIYTDNYFAYPALESIGLALKYSTEPIFLYQLNYRGINSFSQIFGDEYGNYGMVLLYKYIIILVLLRSKKHIINISGVCHADDLMYLFPIHFLKKPMEKSDLAISDLIITLWTNFASSGYIKTLSIIFNLKMISMVKIKKKRVFRTIID